MSVEAQEDIPSLMMVMNITTALLPLHLLPALRTGSLETIVHGGHESGRWPIQLNQAHFSQSKHPSNDTTRYPLPNDVVRQTASPGSVHFARSRRSQSIKDSMVQFPRRRRFRNAAVLRSAEETLPLRDARLIHEVLCVQPARAQRPRKRPGRPHSRGL